MKNDEDFLRLAVEYSQKSADTGNFPAGGVVVKEEKVIASEISSPYPGLFHADAKAVSKAFEGSGPLTGAVLYVSMEPCLMCTSVAYWAGIRRIVYAVPKTKVSGDYYETHEDTHPVVENFNEFIEMIHIESLELGALKIIREWEKKV